MNKAILGLSLAAAFTVGTGTANAVLIDDFNGGAQSVIAPGTDTVSYAGAIGGFRTVGITKAGPLGANATVITPPGIFSHSADALTSATSTITWDGNGAGLGGVDFIDGLINNVFNIDILSIDQGSIDFILGITDTSAGFDSVTSSGAGVGILSILFSSFTGVDFTSVDSVRLDIQGGEASDLTLDLIATTGDQDIPPPSIPEPATLALFGIGLAGLGFARKKKKSA